MWWSGLNWFDFAVLLAVMVSAISGLRAGLARVVIGIAASIAGLLAGFWCYRLAGAKLAALIANETAANVCGFLLIFFGTLLLGAAISAILSKVFQWVGLSWFNHLLGGLAGALRGVIVVGAMLSMIVAFSPSPMPEALTHSKLLPYASIVTSGFVSLAPRELKDAWTEQLENLRQLWRKRERSLPGHGGDQVA